MRYTVPVGVELGVNGYAVLVRSVVSAMAPRCVSTIEPSYPGGAPIPDQSGRLTKSPPQYANGAMSYHLAFHSALDVPPAWSERLSWIEPSPIAEGKTPRTR